VASWRAGGPFCLTGSPSSWLATFCQVPLPCPLYGSLATLRLQLQLQLQLRPLFAFPLGTRASPFAGSPTGLLSVYTTPAQPNFCSRFHSPPLNALGRPAPGQARAGSAGLWLNHHATSCLNDTLAFSFSHELADHCRRSYDPPTVIDAITSCRPRHSLPMAPIYSPGPE